MFKLLILDVDGVLTKNKLYGLQGEVIGKFFNDKDFTAIKQFKACGINVCFLSGDKQVNEAVAKNRNIDFFYAPPINGVIDKSLYLPQIKEKYEVTEEEIAYIGDDYYDISISIMIADSFCPADAAPCLKKAILSQRIGGLMKTKSGEGVVAELFDAVSHLLPEVYPLDHL